MNKILSLLGICCSMLAFPTNAVVKPTADLTQYVLVPLYADAGPYLLKIALKASGLKATINNCGMNCQLVKLSTTATSTDGQLSISLNDKRAGCYGLWSVPFSVVDNQLITNAGVYQVYLQGAACVTQTWQMEVVENIEVEAKEDAALSARYEIRVAKVN